MKVLTKVSQGMILSVNGIEYVIREMSLDNTQTKGLCNNFYFKAVSEDGDEIEIDFPKGNLAVSVTDLLNLAALLTSE